MRIGAYKIDYGFVITKAPLESPKALSILKLGQKAIASGKTVGIFLISDGIWLAKNHQQNDTGKLILQLCQDGAEIIASQEHLEAAGISPNDIIKGIKVSSKPYDDLVDSVMEHWRWVITI
jgi:sulfur relay (sulfurtransferase) complex TusBCD TusD component (DsrE family)